MRKLKLQVQMSVDGFVSTGPNDEQGWVTWAWEEIQPQVTAMLESSDTIIIGRKLAVDYIPYWEATATKPDDQMHGIAQYIVRSKKIVFTKTIHTSIWPNTEVATGDLVTEIMALKSQEGKDIMVYGGSSFVASLIREGLVDELHLFINPVALGKGDSVFSLLRDWQKFKLQKTIQYESGILLVSYETR